MRSRCRRGRSSGSRVSHGNHQGEGLSLSWVARVSSGSQVLKAMCPHVPPRRLSGWEGSPHIYTRFVVNGGRKGLLWRLVHNKSMSEVFKA